MRYDALVIGAGISGLTAGALMAKRGLRVAVADKSYCPGGSCGVFKRGSATFDQGSAMLYGFGEKGFNPHRFVFNCLEEPIDILRHEHLYCIHYRGEKIIFYDDIGRFAEELSRLYPAEREGIRRFYADMLKMYEHVMAENPSYSSADETDPRSALRSMLRHPVSYLRFLGLLNKSAADLLGRYFKDPEIFKFFSKLTSTYCYVTVEEAPAILAAVMFVDNHIGGSYYTAGSTLFLPGKLEKVIEEHGGDMYPEKEAVKILFEHGRPCGALFRDGSRLYADSIVYSGTVWNLYGRLTDLSVQKPGRAEWAAGLQPTYPSVVLYAHVDRSVIPEDTLPVEMLAGNPDRVDENEVTAYILSIDDRTLCDEDSHVVIAIGPTFEAFDDSDRQRYEAVKEKEMNRLTAVLEKRFPGFEAAIRYAEAATPRTIERYTNKNGGAVAGPKQLMGQHLLRRLHTRTEWDNLFCCGESTVMGTGTPAVTTSGISAANAVLSRRGLAPYAWRPGMKNYCTEKPRPFTPDMLYEGFPEDERQAMLRASACLLCEHPSCSAGTGADIRGMLRRVTVGNFTGAGRLLARMDAGGIPDRDFFNRCEERCRLRRTRGEPVRIADVAEFLAAGSPATCKNEP